MNQRHAYNCVKHGEFPSSDLAASALQEMIVRHEMLCAAVDLTVTQAVTDKGCRALIREKIALARDGLPLV